MVKRISNSAQRLKEMMCELDLTQADLCKATGLSKSVISLYVNGKRDPRQDNLALIAETYNVNPAWLMGVDVPMQTEKTYSKKSADFLMDALEDEPIRKVIEIMHGMNSLEKETVRAYVEFILSQKKSTT